MPIIADNSTPAEIPPEAFEKAAQMRAILEADIFEDEKARQVYAFDTGGQELEMVTWPLLVWKERNAWKIYYGIGYGMRIRQV
jgi:hypothetical protein